MLCLYVLSRNVYFFHIDYSHSYDKLQYIFIDVCWNITEYRILLKRVAGKVVFVYFSTPNVETGNCLATNVELSWWPRGDASDCSNKSPGFNFLYFYVCIVVLLLVVCNVLVQKPIFVMICGYSFCNFISFIIPHIFQSVTNIKGNEKVQNMHYLQMAFKQN